MLTIESKLLACGILIIAFMAAGNLTWPTHANTIELLQGETAVIVEGQYDEAFPTRNFAVNLWTALSLVMFNEGKAGVVVGNNGWLYSQEEFIAEKTAQQIYKENLEYIQSVAATLEANQMTLVIAPIPAKTRLYPEYIGDHKTDRVFEGLYQQFGNDLANSGIANTDSMAALTAEKISHPVFLRTDTHWTPEGAAAVARQVAAVQGSNGDTTYDKVVLTPTWHEGDLKTFLPLSPWFETLMPPSDLLTRWQITPSSEALDLFAEAATPSTVLVGTSFSHNENWQFADSLRQALSTDLINLAESGKGPFIPMATFIAEHLEKMSGNGVVIWEIPERYLISSSYQYRGDSK